MSNGFTKIKGISTVRRLPRLGKIRLGIKIKKAKKDGRCKHGANETCMYCTYPKETDYFVVPHEVAKVYGEQPKELDIMVPVNDENIFFPQAYKFYGFGRGVKCIGNGEVAREATDDGFRDKTCPCELLTQKKCSLRAHLLVILPKVNLGGVYQIDIGSWHSVVDINSGIDYVRGMVTVATGTDRIALLPLRLVREPRTTYGDGKMQTHFTLKLFAPQMNLEHLERLRTEPRTVNFLLPPAEDVNPVFDDGPVVQGNGDEPDYENGEYEENEPETEQKQVHTPAINAPEGSIEWYVETIKAFNGKTSERDEWIKEHAIDIKRDLNEDEQAILRKLIREQQPSQPHS